MKDLWTLSATELSAAYRSGETTPLAILDAVLTRCEAVNPRINAVITLDRDGARQQASESVNRWRMGRPLGPLDGIPVTIKDSILVRSLRATWGSRAYADYVPDADEPPVARLREAGAVILGKTNVPEFTVHGFTDNPLFGATRNPWNLELTPGGSSGGAVAAVASGIGALALGTDGGGSIRRPAAHTGLIGFKPSRGAVPRENGFPAILLDFEVIGPIAREIEDIVLAMQVIGGPQFRGVGEPAEKPLRILHIETFGGAPVDPLVAHAAASAANLLSDAGHRVERAAQFDLADPVADAWPVISATGVAWLMSKHKHACTQAGPLLAELGRAGAKLTAVDYLGALDGIARMKRDFDKLFSDFDVLLTPTTAAMPWPATESHPPVIARRPVGPRGHAVFTPFANALGLPAISLPCPVAADALPIGFQLCMAAGHDQDLLALAIGYRQLTRQRFVWPPL